MFMGEYHHLIDEKNRIIIPSKFRDLLGSSFIITRGIEECLYIYSQSDWENIVKKLDGIPFTRSDARKFMRFFLSGAAVAEFDKQGRIVLSNSLVNYSNITKECVIIGAGARLEVWSLEKWNEFFDSAKYNMSDIAENLFNESGV